MARRLTIKPNRPYYSDTLGLDDPDGVLRGVFVGGCVDERGAWRVWEECRSHAHYAKDDAWKGWVCVYRPSDVLTPTGRMTATLAHELSHLLADTHLHDRAWKKRLTEMGFASEIVACKLKPL